MGRKTFSNGHIVPGEYVVSLLDEEGNVIHSISLRENQNQMRKLARFMLTDEFAKNCESSHRQLGTHSVKVTNQDGVVIFDQLYRPKFGPKPKNKGEAHA